MSWPRDRVSHLPPSRRSGAGGRERRHHGPDAPAAVRPCWFQRGSNHLEGIEEVLSFGAQASEPVFLRQGLHRNVMLGLLAQLFEIIDLRIENLNLFLPLSLALLKGLDFRFRRVRG